MKKLDQFPFELIGLIVDRVNKKDLYACALINKAFYKQVIPVLWRQLDIYSIDTLKNVIHAMATSCRSPGNHVRSVTLKQFQLRDTDLLALTQHIPLLEHLALGLAYSISDTSLQHVPRHCPHLMTLDIYNGGMTLQSMIAFGQHCHQLSVVRVTYFQQLDYAALLSALRSCPLKTIDLTPADMYPEESRRFAKTVALALHRHHHQHLTTLSLQSNGENDYTSVFLTTNKYDLTWPHLSRLTLDACHQLDDHHAIPFLKSHPQLEFLVLVDTRITDRTLDAIATYLPRLSQLVVFYNLGLTATGVCRLVTHRSANLEKGVWCNGCGICINDDDFPKDLDPQFYKLGFADDRPMLVWLAGDAFDQSEHRQRQKQQQQQQQQ